MVVTTMIITGTRLSEPGVKVMDEEVRPMQERPLSGLRIGLFGKGGAGKSTVTVFLATSLRTLGYSVVVLDADSTNVGLAKALGIRGDRRPLRRRPKSRPPLLLRSPRGPRYKSCAGVTHPRELMGVVWVALRAGLAVA